MCPTYNYECDNCQHAFEKRQSMTEAKLKKCPECGRFNLVRLIGSGSGFILKGEGFYEQIKKDSEYQKPMTIKKEK